MATKWLTIFIRDSDNWDRIHSVAEIGMTC